MMKTMRKMTRSILWIVIAAFVGTIVFAWGMEFTSRKSKQGVIAVINGKDIPYQSFQYLYEQKLRDAEKKSDEVTDQVAKDLRDQAWSELVDQTLLAQEVKKKGIVITNKELYEFMKRFPPKEIMESEGFQTNGKFDYNKYLQALTDPRVPWGQIEGLIRNQLMVGKLQESIIGSIRINDQEVYRKYVNDNQKVRVNYIFVPTTEFPASGIKLDQSEIQKYYDENKDKFKMTERAILRFVEFPKAPSKEDEEKTKSRLVEIRDLALKGEDFAGLAKEYSEDQATKKNGGDLGWFRKGSMKKSFDEVAFTLKPGEISEPVKTEYSFYLIKLLDKRKTKEGEEIHASHIALKVAPSEVTFNKIKSRIDEFLLKARKMGFDKAAAEEKLDVKESGMFIKGSFIPDLGFSAEANKFAFENKPGKISDPIESQVFYYVVQVKERKPAGIPPLSDAEPFVKQALLNKKQYELAYQKGTKIYEEIKKGKDFKKAAEENNEKVMDSGEFYRSSYVSGVGQIPEFAGTAFALNEKGQVCSPVELTTGTYILQLVSKSAVNDSLYQTQSDSLKVNLLRRKQYDFYTQWFDNLKKNAKIQDFRDQYYKETY
ncbi:MAG: peptidylprolyl isomerase [candidate division Zixibacteria bacterium]|nr:peptidylprolyl isomerase [candidate division Zixibacteria bacterium]